MLNRVLGNLGWGLLAAILIFFVVAAISVPSILGFLNYDVSENFGPATRIIVQVTFGAWVSSAFMSIAPFFVWLYAKIEDPDPDRYKDNRDDALKIRNGTAWAVGLMTALGLYAIQWLGSG